MADPFSVAYLRREVAVDAQVAGHKVYLHTSGAGGRDVVLWEVRRFYDFMSISQHLHKWWKSVQVQRFLSMPLAELGLSVGMMVPSKKAAEARCSNLDSDQGGGGLRLVPPRMDDAGEVCLVLVGGVVQQRLQVDDSVRVLGDVVGAL